MFHFKASFHTSMNSMKLRVKLIELWSEVFAQKHRQIYRHNNNLLKFTSQLMISISFPVFSF